MAGKDNLVPNDQRTPEERRENARKAGRASGQARREKKTVRKILEELLESEVGSLPGFAKVAQRAGIESKNNIKDMFAAICLLNSAKTGNLSDLERLSALLGEDTKREGDNGILDELVVWLKGDQADAE